MKTFFLFLLAVTCTAKAPATSDSPFFWGVSNSAFQVEGSPVDSDWSRWTKQKGRIKDSTDADVATDFWNRYSEDFTIAQNAGLNAFRISIAWERIEPKPGQWDEKALAHYEAMIADIRSKGMEPFVTLHHYVLPGWMADRGGLLAPSFVEEFADYSEKVVERLSQGKADVKYWLTFNEPMILLRSAYFAKDWPPAAGSADQAMEAAAQLARAHIKAVGKMRALGRPSIQVSIAKNWQYFERGDRNPLSFFTVKMMEWIYNHQFLEALTTGELHFWYPGAKSVKDQVPLPEGRSTLDYLGVNNYGRWLVEFQTKKPYFKKYEGTKLTQSDLGWEIYPLALYHSIRKASRYGIPVIVTENGVADADDKIRGDFIRKHVALVQRAREEGLPLFGYIHWSLTDNFEWSYGLTPRFGLVEIDYNSLRRTPRPSLGVYSSLVKQYP